jgi:ribosomal protein L40E
MANYTEEEMMEYIFKNFYNLLKLEEKAIYSKLVFGMKLKGMDSNEMKRRIQNMFNYSDIEMEEILKDGGKEFRKKVCQRIMAEDAEQVKLNLCPKCNALTRTLTAKQCPKCFYNWHF